VRYSGFLRPGMGLLMATLAATIGFSLLVHLGVERRIETLRAAIKRRRWVSSFAWRSRSDAAPALPAERASAGKRAEARRSAWPLAPQRGARGSCGQY
jgi:peptidoglycan/LPS O-acetylase OafA/YrhL